MNIGLRLHIETETVKLTAIYSYLEQICHIDFMGGKPNVGQ